MSAIDNCLLAKNPSLSPAAADYTEHIIHYHCQTWLISNHANQQMQSVPTNNYKQALSQSAFCIYFDQHLCKVTNT